jgi:hypothetical protein
MSSAAYGTAIGAAAVCTLLALFFCLRRLQRYQLGARPEMACPGSANACFRWKRSGIDSPAHSLTRRRPVGENGDGNGGMMSNPLRGARSRSAPAPVPIVTSEDPCPIDVSMGGNTRGDTEPRSLYRSNPMLQPGPRLPRQFSNDGSRVAFEAGVTRAPEKKAGAEDAVQMGALSVAAASGAEHATLYHDEITVSDGVNAGAESVIADSSAPLATSG